jgi:hypothetical protein
MTKEIHKSFDKSVIDFKFILIVVSRNKLPKKAENLNIF